MSDRIPIQTLREVVARDPSPSSANIALHGWEVLALVEAVEAARWLKTVHIVTDGKAKTAWVRLDKALARFDFGDTE